MPSPSATLAALLLLLLTTPLLASPTPSTLEKRQWTDTKYCDAQSTLCYLEITLRGTNPVFRIAIPDGSSSGFDTILQIISPVSLGWAGFAWGGGMTLNPLTVAWPNGNKATVSSRWSTGRTLPSVYSGATYKTLSSSKNSTHWTIEVACTGCSKWSGGQLSTTDLNTFAWAVSKTAVTTPSSSSSNFAYHSNVGMFTEKLTFAKNPASAFSNHVKSASG